MKERTKAALFKLVHGLGMTTHSVYHDIMLDEALLVVEKMKRDHADTTNKLQVSKGDLSDSSDREAQLRNDVNTMLVVVSLEEEKVQEIMVKKDRAIGRAKRDKDRLGRLLSAAYEKNREMRADRHELHLKHRSSEQERNTLALSVVLLKKQRDSHETGQRLAEEETARRIRIQRKVQEGLTRARDEADRYKKELGWYPVAYDSLTRGLDTVTSELSPMAQLAIAQLQASAESWIKHEEEEDE